MRVLSSFTLRGRQDGAFEHVWSLTALCSRPRTPRRDVGFTPGTDFTCLNATCLKRASTNIVPRNRAELIISRAIRAASGPDAPPSASDLYTVKPHHHITLYNTSSDLGPQGAFTRLYSPAKEFLFTFCTLHHTNFKTTYESFQAGNEQAAITYDNLPIPVFFTSLFFTFTQDQGQSETMWCVHLP